jgi:hypothetical protein
MAAPIMRRLALPLLAFFALLPLPAGTASAQEASPAPTATPPTVRLTLLSQTPWASPSQREVLLRFRAENLGEAPIGELSIGVTLYGRVITRTAYEASLVSDPPFALSAETLPREGVLEPGFPRDFEVAFPLGSGLDPDDSGVYPLKIDVRSGFTSLAALRTAVVFLVREPEQPLAISWTFVLDYPIAFGPDGVFTSDALEVALAPGGRIAAQINALLQLAENSTQPAVDVAVSPILLGQLDQMREGYDVMSGDGFVSVPQGEGGARLAQQALDGLRTVAHAPNVRISALPFSVPELPSLLSGGLAHDLSIQLDRGREIVGATLDTTPLSSVLRPPGAALDDSTLQELSGSVVSTLIAGPTTVQPAPQPLGFVGPPTAALGPEGQIAAVVPEPELMALLESPVASEDPVRAAQILLGELATIWQEQPGVARGVAIVLSEDLQVAPAFYGAVARDIAGAPWLAPMHAGDFVTTYAPSEPSPLASPTPRRFSTTYVGALKQARRRVDTYRSMLIEPSDGPDRYDRMLLLAESREYLSDPAAGLAFIQTVRDQVGEIFDGISVDSASQITLTSSTGSGIPVTVSNGADEGLRVTVQLVSQFLRGSPSVDLELAPGDSQTVTFRVDALSTGRFTVQLRVLAPGGRILDEQVLIVRSTVYNRIALVITIAAAVVLLGLWARRFLLRRTS